MNRPVKENNFLLLLLPYSLYRESNLKVWHNVLHTTKMMIESHRDEQTLGTNHIW